MYHNRLFKDFHVGLLHVEVININIVFEYTRFGVAESGIIEFRHGGEV